MKRGRKPLFYVFYDQDDFVKCCGTARELVAQGTFQREEYIRELASKIKRKEVKGNVVILPLVDNIGGVGG